MTAYYNEIDPIAAQWLRNLIAADHIAPGDVDERSIVDVDPSDLQGYTQVHLFAGIGVWSYGLRRAGWDDTWPIWTGSCPCPPFSAAGKSKACSSCGGTNPVCHVARTGVFVCCSCGHEWLADERHLWPEFARLVWERRPGLILGEQVASADGRIWVDLVCSSLEIMGYSAAAVDTSSAIHGAPHIRQRIRFAAHNHESGVSGLAHAEHDGQWQHGECLGGKAGASEGGSGERQRVRAHTTDGLTAGSLAHANGPEPQLSAGQGARPDASEGAGAHSELDGRLPLRELGTVQLGHAERTGLEGHRGDGDEGQEPGRIDADAAGSAAQTSSPGGTGPTNGPWRDADWLFCRDGKWRPVEPGTFPLAHGATQRVGRLRAYGNAVDAEATRVFCRAVMESLT